MTRLVRMALVLALTAMPAYPTQEEADSDARVRADLALLDEAYAARTQPTAREWRQRVASRQMELATTLDALIAADRGEEALRFVLPFAYFLGTSNQEQTAYEVLMRVLALRSAATPTSARANALHQAGRYAFRRRDQATSRTVNEESLRIARQLNDPAAAANALIGLSRVALRDHDFEKVDERAREAADIRASIGDDPGRVAAMHMVAAAARMKGDDVRAQQLYEQTLASYRANGNRAAAAGEVYNLGYVHLHQDRVDRARELFRQALGEYRALNSEAGIAYCLTGFAAAAALQQRADRAALLWGAASAFLAGLGITLDPDDQLEWDRYTHLARSHVSAGRYRRAFEEGKTLTKDRAIVLALAGDGR